MATQAVVETTETPAQVVRKYRGDRTLDEFGKELSVGRQWVYNWEHGKSITDATIQSWWDDPREWVQKLALDVLAAKFAGIREAFLAEAAQPAAENGKAKKST